MDMIRKLNFLSMNHQFSDELIFVLRTHMAMKLMRDVPIFFTLISNILGSNNVMHNWPFNAYQKVCKLLLNRNKI